MFGTGLIVFRETLEAALFVGIVAAATLGVLNRARWLSLGMLAGVCGSVLMALAMGEISAWADGIGQDIVSTVVIGLALCMLAWHCIWVSNHSHLMVQDAKRLGAATLQGQHTLWALAIAVALSVLREGAETVLFVAGLMAQTKESQSALILSSVFGLAAGLLAGWLVYAGLGKVKPQRLFLVTNALILLLAGSLASQLAKTVTQAGWVSVLAERAWDLSWLIPNDGVIGMVLHGILGYDASPSQLQLLSYFSTTVLIWALTNRVKFNVIRGRLSTPITV